ncbi:CHAT domain-containing protein [Actinophytocola oryzae]|uniref:CHAT domain-containing protein n=1 Tax=Actinophytocola oryzae TaxID=502181 RepID=A0A4R7W5T5_9PSEU|nr:CHAT domain-containing protein [Actinophytocola oryzae]TDV57488.1 CHAT domain-containing protein [Actinophytocola oryzae]
MSEAVSWSPRTGEPERRDGDRTPHHLLQLVFADPNEAIRQANAVLACSPTPLAASIAHQAIGIVQRDFGDLTSAITELRLALTLARKSGSTEREADVLATFGIALVHDGRTRTGLATLDRAVAASTGTHGARVRFRRGGALWVLGRHRDALDDLRAAVMVLRRAKDTVWTGRVLAVRGQVHLALGAVERADADFTEAARLFAETDQEHDSAVAVQNLGLTAFRTGDLPAALTRLEDADRRFHRLDTPMPELVADRCAVLLAAGLPNEALLEADAAIAEVTDRNGQTTRRAELLLVAGRAALAAKKPRAALERASEAVRLFTAQRREWWRQHARLLALQARFATEPGEAGQLAQVREVVKGLGALHAPDLIEANLLAGRVALAMRRPAREHLRAAATARHGGSAITRAEGWLAQALLAAVDDNTRLVLQACRRGLDVLDEHRLTLGASELRARATDHGAELAELALRTCLRGSRARRLLMWSERWRATVCAVPAVRPPTDNDVLHDLATLRATTSRLDEALVNGTPFGALATRSQRLERRIRDRVRRQPGTLDGAPGTAHGIVRPLLDELGDGRLAAIVPIDGDLHVLVCGGGRVTRTVAGKVSVAAGHVETACWLLRRLAYGPVPGVAERLLARLEVVGRQLEEHLLGGARLGDGPVVIVPPGRFQAVPWALLPGLRDRVHSVAPSATTWVNARRAPRPAGGKVVLVRGPGLASSGGEIPHLAAAYPDAHVIENEAATASAVLRTIDGSSLVHLAAHGRFRADSPMFSSIRLADGPLTVYDFQQLRRTPYRMILPSCDSGAVQPVGADELLGLTAALLPLGTAGIAATVVPVNDTATVSVMRAMHTALNAGNTTLGEALATARATTPADPVAVATAWSFVALGAA